MTIFFLFSLLSIIVTGTVSGFTVTGRQELLRPCFLSKSSLAMSFVADSSDYKSSDSDYTSDDDGDSAFGVPVMDKNEEESPSIEESPVPMSKNGGNRFVALIFDKSLSTEDADVMELHRERIELTEDHVIFCRKANLYNETFNTDSMADVVWSHQILASDMKRTIGHAMCIESTELEHVQELLSRDPIVQHLTGGDTTKIPLYRWRQIRDHTLRQDDGRTGSPTLLIAMDRSAEEGVGNLREEITKDHLEYLIRSERVIAAGPLHLPTEFKDDPSSIAVGSFVLYNAPNREDAIKFAESDPAALAGLYGSMRVHRYNSLDVSGKFVAENLVLPEKNQPTADLREAMEYWGYPVDEQQTKWINW